MPAIKYTCSNCNRQQFARHIVVRNKRVLCRSARACFQARCRQHNMKFSNRCPDTWGQIRMRYARNVYHGRTAVEW